MRQRLPRGEEQERVGNREWGMGNRVWGLGSGVWGNRVRTRTTHHGTWFPLPCPQVLMQRLLRLQVLRHEHDGATGEFLVQPRGHKGMTRARDPATRERAARLHTPQQGLRSGSSAKSGKEWVEHEADGPHQQAEAVTHASAASRAANLGRVRLRRTPSADAGGASAASISATASPQQSRCAGNRVRQTLTLPAWGGYAPSVCGDLTARPPTALPSPPGPSARPAPCRS